MHILRIEVPMQEIGIRINAEVAGDKSIEQLATDLENLAKVAVGDLQNAAKAASGQPNNEPAPQSGPEPTPEPELKPSIPEQPAPADGEAS